MLFVVLQILFFVALGFWIFFVISLFKPNLSSEDVFFVSLTATIVCVFLAIFPAVFAFIRSYDYNERFDVRYATLLEQEKILKLKKDKVVSESRELNKELTSPDLLSLKDKTYIENMIAEIKQAETTLYSRRLQLFYDILEHNGKCRYWWGGKWVVDTDRFPLLNIELNKSKEEN